LEGKLNITSVNVQNFHEFCSDYMNSRE